MLSPASVGSEHPPDHHYWMQRCLMLAKQAQGRTAPNPMVGCVIVQGQKVVGEGFHPQAGEPHAEVFALRAAGDRARGATLYVNLEPCSHFGRTPPCADAVVAAGLARVVVGMVDPDSRVSGRGIRRLRNAGIEVIEGVDSQDCQALNEAFIHRVTHHQPLGILKYAMTLDGKIATVQGHSAWVSGTPARTYVHQLRSQSDAVIVGTNTVRLDNPQLTSHRVTDLEGGSQPPHNPLRVVMSRSLKMPLAAKLWQTHLTPTLVFTERTADLEMQQHLRQQNVEVIALETLTPKVVMTCLYERGCSTVLWESGGQLAAAAIAEGCIQKVLAFIAPKIVGGVAAPSPVGDLGFVEMTQALPIQRVTWTRVGEDFLLTGYLPGPEGAESSQ